MEKCQQDMENSMNSPNMYLSKLQLQFVYHNEAVFVKSELIRAQYVRKQEKMYR